MKNSIHKIFIPVVCAVLIVLAGCTNLDEEVEDQVLQSEYPRTEGELNTLLGPLYSSLGEYWNRFELLNCVTDEELAPTRGGDWGEPEWRFMEEHTWPTNFYGFDGLWTWIYTSIAQVNLQIENPALTEPAAQAELRTLRAFYHYLAMDNFGNVPISNSRNEEPQQRPRAEVYDFVESELLASIPNLSGDVQAKYGQITKYVGQMILAKLYLNAEVYTGTPEWEKARQYCDSIILSNKFSISSDFLSIFSTNNKGNSEIILATPYDKSKKTGFFLPMTTLHYLHQQTYNFGSQPWNGYCTYAEFYDSFEPEDTRINMWYTGQITSFSGEPLEDDGVPAILTKEIPSFIMPAGTTARLAGYRCIKYQPQVGATFDHDNDFVIYRISDVYLMRAEANFRLNNLSAALDDINSVRSERNVDPFVTITADDILAERGRELAWEYHRRQDLIRFGQFTKAWTFKPVSDEYRELFPIPLSQIALNPALIQNPGYAN